MHTPCAREILNVLDPLEVTYIPLYNRLASKPQALVKQALRETIKEIRGQIIMKVPVKLRAKLKWKE